MDQNYLPNRDELSNLIKEILSGNNDKIKMGTKFLKGYTKRVESIEMLVDFMVNCQDNGIRQFAIVLLKRNMIQLYQKVDENVQKTIRDQILIRFKQEPQNNIRNTIGNLIGDIGTITIANNKWPEVFQMIREEQNLLGLQLIGYLLESSGSFMDQHYEDFIQYFMVNIQSNMDKKIRKQTLKNIMFLLDNLEQFNKKQKELVKEKLIEPMIDVLTQCLNDNDEDMGTLCLETLSNIVQTSNILDKNLSNILNTIQSPKMLLNREMSFNLKEQIIDFIFTLVENKKKIWQNEVIKQVLENMAQIISQPIVADDLEDDQETIQDIAVNLVEAISNNLPRKKVYPEVMKIIDQLINNKTGNIDHIMTGFLILGGIIEGCAQSLRKHMDSVMGYIKQGLQSNEEKVRGPTIKVICLMSEYLSTEILIYHKVIINSLIENIVNNPSKKVQEKALIALDVLCENMEQESIEQHIDNILPKLNDVIQNNQYTVFMKQLSMSCIGSCIQAQGIHFKKYAIDLCQYLHNIINEGIQQPKLSQEQTEYLGEIIMVLGRISYYVCRDTKSSKHYVDNYQIDQPLYQSCVMPAMENIYQFLMKEQLKEASINFFYNVADTIGNEFSVLLDKVMPEVLKSASSNKGVDYVKQKKQEFSLDTDSEDEYETDFKNMNVKVTVMDEKASAIHALGSFAKSCNIPFQKYYKQVISILDENYNSFYDNIRVQCIITYENIALSLVKSINNNQLPTKQQMNGLQYPQDIVEFINIELFTKYLYFLEEDTSSEVVTTVLDCLNSLILTLGQPLLQTQLNNINNCLLLILKNESKAQNDEELDDIEDVREDIFEIMTDIIPSLNKVLQGQYNPLFDQLWPAMKHYLDLEKEINYQVQMIGCVAECFKYNTSLIITYQDKVLPYLLSTVELEDDEINRNTAFCLGIMSQYNALQMQSHYVNLLQYLQKTYISTSDLSAKDNILSAISRMVIGSKGQNIPMDSVMPNLMASFPLKSDKSEQKTIIKFMIFLCAELQDYAQQYLSVIVYNMLQAVQNQNDYQFSNKFINLVVDKLNLLVQNSVQAKQQVQEYFTNTNNFKDENQKNKLMTRFQ